MKYRYHAALYALYTLLLYAAVIISAIITTVRRPHLLRIIICLSTDVYTTHAHGRHHRHDERFAVVTVRRRPRRTIICPTA